MCLSIKCMSHIPLQVPFEIFLAAINILWVTLDRRAEMLVGPPVKCSLLSSDFNQIWNVPTYVSKSSKYQIS